jgi:amino acid transporter
VAILFTTVLAVGLLIFAGGVSQLGGTTALLLLAVFAVVNITCLVLRKDTKAHKHFVAPTVIPIIGALCCAFLVGPWTGRNPVQYSIAGVLIAIGVALWLITWLINRAIYSRKTYLKDPSELDGDRPSS